MSSGRTIQHGSSPPSMKKQHNHHGNEVKYARLKNLR